MLEAPIVNVGNSKAFKPIYVKVPSLIEHKEELTLGNLLYPFNCPKEVDVEKSAVIMLQEYHMNGSNFQKLIREVEYSRVDVSLIIHSFGTLFKEKLMIANVKELSNIKLCRFEGFENNVYFATANGKRVVFRLLSTYGKK